jgi:hypothetical protein
MKPALGLFAAAGLLGLALSGGKKKTGSGSGTGSGDDIDPAIDHVLDNDERAQKAAEDAAQKRTSGDLEDPGKGTPNKGGTPSAKPSTTDSDAADIDAAIQKIKDSLNSADINAADEKAGREKAAADAEAKRIADAEAKRRKADAADLERQRRAEPAMVPTDKDTPHDVSSPASSAQPTLPAGYNPARARTLAKSLAQHIASKRYDYSRDLMKDFQRCAGIPMDGVYGGESRGALIYFGAANAPKPLFKPTETLPYVSPEQRG